MIRRLAIVLAILGLLVGLGLVIWQRTQSMRPEELFYDALQRNLQETAVTCTVNQTTSDTRTEQIIALDMHTRANLRSVTTLRQADTVITTEELANKTNSYVRYTSIRTDKKTRDGSTPDFSKALNTWSISPVREQGSTLYGRTALGNCIVPLTEVSAGQARTLIAELRKGKVFVTDFTASKESELRGSRIRTYDVTVQPRAYIEYMKQVAKASGLRDLDGIKAADFDKKTPEKLRFMIDIRTGRLQRIEFTGSKNIIKFSEYGTPPRIVIPTSTISAEELKRRLQAPTAMSE